MYSIDNNKTNLFEDTKISPSWAHRTIESSDTNLIFYYDFLTTIKLTCAFYEIPLELKIDRKEGDNIDIIGYHIEMSPQKCFVWINHQQYEKRDIIYNLRDLFKMLRKESLISPPDFHYFFSSIDEVSKLETFLMAQRMPESNRLLDELRKLYGRFMDSRDNNGRGTEILLIGRKRKDGDTYIFGTIAPVNMTNLIY